MKSLVRRYIPNNTKRLFKAAMGKDIFIRVDRDYEKEKFGSDYGGWHIAPHHITQESTVYSVGIGEDVSFDLAMIERFGVVVHGFDPTPKSIEWVRKQNLPKNFVLHEYGLADFDGTVSFNPPENPQHVSHTLLARPATTTNAIQVSVKTLETIRRELEHQHIDLLKMDIEGAEYQVIDHLAQSNLRPVQLLIEFHHRFSDIGTQKTKNAVGLLHQMGYCLFSVSSSGEEFSFILNSAIR